MVEYHGPWKFVTDGYEEGIIDNRGYEVIAVRGGYYEDGHISMSHDVGHLIAAAPCMLELLEDAKNGLLWWVETHPESASEADFEKINQIEEVIAKAKGQEVVDFLNRQ